MYHPFYTIIAIWVVQMIKSNNKISGELYFKFRDNVTTLTAISHKCYCLTMHLDILCLLSSLQKLDFMYEYHAKKTTWAAVYCRIKTPS